MFFLCDTLSKESIRRQLYILRQVLNGQSKMGKVIRRREGVIMLHTLELSTSGRDEMRDITREVASLIEKSGVQEGTALIYCPHTTAGIAINENADPDVKHDVILRLENHEGLTM
jgi:hypothetical protein